MSPADQVLFNTMVSWLDSHGYTVILKPNQDNTPWISFADYCDQLDVHKQTLSMKLRHPNCPPFCKLPETGTRIMQLVPNEKLTQFIKQYGNNKIV
jgi:hypothetical protein